MRPSVLVLLLTVVPLVSLGDEDRLSPALQAYDAVTVYRERHGEVIWDGAPATETELRQVLADLQTGLTQLDEPLNRDLATGNERLLYRRFNFLVDVIKVLARLGDSESALNAWDRMDALAILPGHLEKMLADPHVAGLADHPRFARIRERAAVAERWAGASALKTPYRETLPVAERVAGLSRLWTEARENFVWFDQVPRLDWDKTYLDYLPQVIATDSTEDYYRLLMRFVALLQDGHSNVYAPEPLRERFYSRPPLRTELVEGRVLVTSVWSTQLAQRGVSVGDELLSIDGRPVHEYAAEVVLPRVSASTPQDREVRAYGYELLAGAAERPIRLELTDARGRRSEIELARTGYLDVEMPEQVEFRMLDDDTAYLRVAQFGDEAGLKAFEAHLDQIMEAPAFILDLRGNGGGSSNHGWDILTYLSPEPVPTMRSRYRFSNALRQAQSPTGAAIFEWREVAGGEHRRPRERHYDGPVAVLIDARTFSAGEDTAAAFGLMKRGPLLGQATGGSTGQPLLFDLPGGGLARICVKRDEYPSGGSFVGVGVLPDETIRPTVEDIRGGRDAVLTRAQVLLSSRQASSIKPRP